jgi:penicillin-binding protein 2
VLLGAVAFGALFGALVVGARWAMRDSPETPPAVETAEPGSPEATAVEFARAWTRGDINALYLLLSPESQRTYSPQIVSEAYRTFSDELTQTGLAAEVTEADRARATLGVRVNTAYFGTIEYTTALNLEPGTAGYVVVWTPATIHPGMVNGRTFRGVVERPRRGTIFDRNGLELAVTTDVRSVGLNRSIVQDRAGLEAALIAFGFTKEQVDAAFNSPFAANARVRVGPIPEERAAEANDNLRPIPGVIIYFESQRVHPLGAAAAHVVGYTREYTAEELAARAGEGLRIGDRRGAIGLEASQEAVLAGSIGARLTLVDAGGTVIETVFSREFVQGQDVQTTLDADTLVRSYERLGTRRGASVVIDPVTNDILALNSSPSFDPDAFETNDSVALAAIIAAEGSPQANRATAGLYSAGSTFKLVTGAAGLVYGGYEVTDRIPCTAIWYGVDPPRRNWEGTQGPLTIAQGLMRSCNPVFYEIGLKLYDTDNLLSQMARMFGFGEETGVVGIGEEAGLVPDAIDKRERTGEPWYPGDDVNLAIGQGDLLITPLQLANAYSTFVTRELRAPRLLMSEEATKRGDLPLTDQQWSHLDLGLRLVTGAGGTARSAFTLAGYTNFSGKSGTAEDANEQQHVLFVAMGPASSPRAVAAVVLDDGDSGSIEAGPIARDLVIAALD